LNADENGHRARSLSALYRLDRLIEHSGGYDVLHAHFGPVGDAFRFARELWKAPLAVSFHGYDFTTLPRAHGEGIYRKLFDTADAVTANSGFTRGRVEMLGCPASKLHLLPVGLDLGAFPFEARTRHGNEPVRLITVARLVEIKGHEFVLRALARVRAQHPEIRYDLIGDGPLRKKLEALVVELGLQDAVTFHGAREGAFVRDLMKSAHLALLGSVNIEGDAEGQGLFLQEAQACGLPVVATQHGALPEGMLPGKSGFLVPERDVDALARQLEALLAHPETWPEMGSRGRTFVEKQYDIHQLNERLVELYRKITIAFRQGTNGGTS
jgi:colanic acid/amylovoran biosynthesis glycosyltransferase